MAALKEVYQKYVSSTSKTPSISSLIEKRKNWINNSNLFYDLVIKEYPWSVDYNAEEYLNLLKTQTIYQQFTSEQKQDLSQEVREIINGHGGYLKRPYLSVLFLAQKQASN